MANVFNNIAQYLATVPLARRQQAQENELANRRLALQEEEDKRKAQMDAISQQLAQGSLENAQFEAEQRQKGQGQLEDYGRAAEIQPSINELRQGKELSKNVAPYSMDYLLAQPEATPLALADKYKLSQYSPYNKGVKSTLENVNTATQRDILSAQKEAELAQKQDVLESKEKMAGEKNALQQSLLDEKLKAGASQAELNRLAAEERARIAAEAKGNNLKPEEKTQHAYDVTDKIDVIEKHPGFKGSVGMKGAMQGFGLMKQPVAGTDEAGFIAEYNALHSLLTLDNIGKLKGTLSDTDMKILKQAATSLDLNMPEKDFKRELARVKDVMTRVTQKDQQEKGKDQITTNKQASTSFDDLWTKHGGK